MNKQDQLDILFQKFIDHSISRSEYDRLMDEVRTGSDPDRWQELIIRELDQDVGDMDVVALTEALDRVDRRIKESIARPEPVLRLPSQRVNRPRRLYPYVAAAMLLIVTLFSVVYFTSDGQLNTSDVEPGSNRATITLTDGQIYHLQDDERGIMTDGQGIRYSDGERVVAQAEPTMVLLTTPKGGQYRVTLPDGTKVYVNADSRLRYPNHFTGGQRQVELEGEAYFEVAHDPEIPFVVRSGVQETRVLGTRFNLTHYASSDPIVTTLLEGRVEVMIAGSGQSRILSPQEQSRFQDSELTVNTVTAHDYIGWTQNVFVFNDLALTDIMDQLARWYDIEVEYPEGFINEHFYAEIPRDRRLSEVLKALERAGRYKFEIEERRVMIRR